MEGKLNILIGYAIFGFIIALWPILVKEKNVSESFQYEESIKSNGFWKFSCFFVALLGVLLITGKSILTLILSFALISLMLSLTTRKLDLVMTLCTFLALCVSTTLLWWHRHGHLLNINAPSMVVICSFTFLFVHVFKINSNSMSKINNFTQWMIPYVIFATIFSFSTGIIANKDIIKTLWHHWGAYIGPAELLLSGAVIFHDFPAQYGLGPTFLIASVCGSDCWQGMYYIAGLTTWLFSLCIASLAFALTPNRWPERLIILSLCLTTCFFWTAFPPLTGSPLETPSVSGLRFLPVTFLVTYLFFVKNIEHSKIKSLVAHFFWMLGALWSPESAFYVTCVWWPYYIFLRRSNGNIVNRLKGVLRSSINLLFIAASLLIIFNIIFYIIYHKGPSLYAFIAYALNPPGVMPINWHGGILYFLLVTSIGIINLFQLWHKSGDTFEFRSGFLILLLCYGVFSYFLGRSHDNTFLNISSFMLLVLLHTIFTLKNQKFYLQRIYLHRICVVCLMALLGWLPAFGWKIWHDNINKGKLFSFNPKLIREYPYINLKFNPGQTTTEEARGTINFLQDHEPITQLNSTFNSIGSEVWNAIHNPANYVFIPAQHRRKFLQATANTLHRSGWLLIEKHSPAEMFLEDFDFAYRRTDYLDFGNYYAIHFIPKQNLNRH